MAGKFTPSTFLSKKSTQKTSTQLLESGQKKTLPGDIVIYCIEKTDYFVWLSKDFEYERCQANARE